MPCTNCEALAGGPLSEKYLTQTRTEVQSPQWESELLSSAGSGAHSL